MVWTAPMTAVANAVWTAAAFNTYVRDNMLATEAATVSAAGQMVFSSGINALAARTATNATVGTAQTTASASYVDLATVGPQVTVTTGATALVYIAANMSNATAGSFCAMSYGVTSATTISASDNWYLFWDGTANVSQPARIGVWHYVANLSTGSNIFTAKYKVESGTGTFSDRELIVFPL